MHLLAPSGEGIEARRAVALAQRVRGAFIVASPHPDLLPVKGDGTFMRRILENSER